MAKELPSRFGITPHATRRMATRQIAIGAAVTLIGALAVAVGALDAGVASMFLVVGAVLAALGLYTRSMGAAVQVVNHAFNLASIGKLTDASELLDFAEATFRSPYIRRVIDLQRAIIAMRRGELEAALGSADAAIKRRISLISRYSDRMQLIAAHAVRAVLRASTGDRDGARGDVEIVRRSSYAVPESLARAELAEALVLERSGDKEALREHLNQERRLLLEHTHPRERAIVRAYQRMLKATSTTIYRTSAPRDPVQSEEPSLSDWAAKISPGAAPFVRAAAPGKGSDSRIASMEAESVDPEARRAAEGRLKAKVGFFRRPIVRLFAVWALCIVMFLVLWQFLLPPDGSIDALQEVDSSDGDALYSWMPILPWLLGVVVFGAIAWRVLQGRRYTRRLIASFAALARGEEDRAVRELTALGRSSAYVVAAQAHLVLAQLAERRGELPRALTACEEALGRLNTNTARAIAVDILLPSLLAERAFLFAATDRGADARAEVALLAERYPSYPYLDREKLRVSLVQKARQGDIESAAKLAEQSADLALNPRDELLADLARAAASPEAAGAGEVARLREELRVDAASRRWVEVVAPAALAAFERAGQEAEEAEEAEREASAEAEAGAEAEARAEAKAERAAAAVR